ncbi:MAG: TlpA family protein disulfide reductase [Gammaproteobacteria bacterium]
MKNTLKLLALTLVVAFSQTQAFAQSNEQKAAPKQWILETLDGEKINLKERIQQPGNRIMVFWATWCPFCKQLMPIVADLKRDYPDLEVLSFNVFDELAREDYATKADWPFIHVLGGDEFARVHGVKGLPTLFLINGEGKMVLDLREIDTKGTEENASNRTKAAHYAPLWNKGLREALDKLDWN